jgi:(2S)-methylsuccinyl-CoA dehydrogenase
MTLMSSASASTTDPHPSAVDLLRRVRSCFDTATAALARACAVDGRLDAAALDRQQVGSYDLAWVSADLLAAETLLSSLGSGSTGVDRRLALVFAAEAVGACLARLESLYLDQGLDLAPLQALSVSSAWAQLRRDGSGAQALADAGQAVVDARGEIAAVALSESLALAQASFRRVAAEVVAPAAEAIHRQDLTVPESVLQPLREMGVFGLAIPERFGGIAPDDRDDTLMMVAVTEALSEASLGAAGSLITRPEILSRALLAGGSDAQKRHWLPKIAAGEPRARWLAAGWGQDLVHLRRQGRVADGCDAHRPRPVAGPPRAEPDAGGKARQRRACLRPPAARRRPAAGPFDPDHRLPRHALLRPVVRELLRARFARHR